VSIDQHAFVATTRFGMGPAPGEAGRIGGDPQGWLIQQLRSQPMPAALAELPGTAELYTRFREVQAQRKAAQLAAATQATQVTPAVTAVTAPSAPQGADTPSGRTDRSAHANALQPPGAAQPQRAALPTPAAPTPPPAPPMGEPLREIYLSEGAARMRVAAGSDTPLYERLVQFWSNHFTVSVARPQVLAIAGAFEREAIRPHVTGNFHDLLRAVVTHPAMLIYLDNFQSIGPDSVAGHKRDKGINENLAREMLELHTLGVDGGYTQADVTSFARVLTGWTLARGQGGELGTFMFEPRMHEPGDKTLLGMTIRGGGQEEGEQILAYVSRHPATARFIATKLVRHFIADDPPRAAVDAVAATFRSTGGDLAAVTKAVIARPEAWDPPLAKMRSPNDLVTAALRALGNPPVADKDIYRSLALLGQPPWAAPSPAGWPDRADAWLGPEALMRRLQWADIVARNAPNADARALAEATIGPVMGPATRDAIAGAANPRERMVMLLASREFERR